MNLVAINFESVPLGEPLPFALRAANGALLAQKGFVVRNASELSEITGRGIQLCVDVDEAKVQALRAGGVGILLREADLAASLWPAAVRRSIRVLPDSSVDSSRVSETVSTAMLTGMNLRVSSMPAMAQP